MGHDFPYKKAQNALGLCNEIFNTNFIYSLRNKANCYIKEHFI